MLRFHWKTLECLVLDITRPHIPFKGNSTQQFVDGKYTHYIRGNIQRTNSCYYTSPLNIHIIAHTLPEQIMMLYNVRPTNKHIQKKIERKSVIPFFFSSSAWCVGVSLWYNLLFKWWMELLSNIKFHIHTSTPIVVSQWIHTFLHTTFCAIFFYIDAFNFHF